MFIIVYITCGSRREAQKISKLLVKEKLVACVNYFQVNSIYLWKNKIENAKEYVLICKTKKKKFKDIEKIVREEHSYENPAILSFKISEGSKDFLNWIKETTE